MPLEDKNPIFDRTILSVHVPKTAGTTMLHLLRRAVGVDAVLADYTDDPSSPTSPRNLDPNGYFSRPAIIPAGILAVHGHFHINKYSTIPKPFRITFLRDPVNTIISIHAYWRTLTRSYNALHDYFLKNQLDIFEMARLPLLRYMLSRNYFESVDMRKFDFIGRYETFSKDVTLLSAQLGVSLVADVHLNRVDKDEQMLDLINESTQTRVRLRDILIEDVKFYEQAIS